PVLPAPQGLRAPPAGQGRLKWFTAGPAFQTGGGDGRPILARHTLAIGGRGRPLEERGANPRRNQRVAVRRLARRALPGRPAETRVAGPSRHAVPHGRGQQLLLSPAVGGDVREVAG